MLAIIEQPVVAAENVDGDDGGRGPFIGYM